MTKPLPEIFRFFSEALESEGSKGDAARLLAEVVGEIWPAALGFPYGLSDDDGAVEKIHDFLQSRLSESDVAGLALQWFIKILVRGNREAWWKVALPVVPQRIQARRLPTNEADARAAVMLERVPVIASLPLVDAETHWVVFAMTVAMNNGATTPEYFDAVLKGSVASIHGWPSLMIELGPHNHPLPLTPESIAAFPTVPAPIIENSALAYKRTRNSLIGINKRFEGLPKSLRKFLNAARTHNLIYGVPLLSEGVRGTHRSVPLGDHALAVALSGRSQREPESEPVLQEPRFTDNGGDYHVLVDACRALRIYSKIHAKGQKVDRKRLTNELVAMSASATGAPKLALEFLADYSKRTAAPSITRAAFALRSIFRDSDSEWEGADGPSELLKSVRISVGSGNGSSVEHAIGINFCRYLARKAGLPDHRIGVARESLDGLVDAGIVSPEEYRRARARLIARGPDSDYLVRSLALMYQAGARVSEVALLQVGDLEEGAELTLKISKKRSKSSIDRKLYLSALLTEEEAVDIRSERRRRRVHGLEASLLVRVDGSPVDADDISNQLGEVLTEVAGRRITAHHLRHTAINRIMAALLGLEINPTWRSLKGFEDSCPKDGDAIRFPKIREAFLGAHSADCAWTLAALAGHVSPATTLASYIHLHEYFFVVQRTSHTNTEMVAALARRLQVDRRSVYRHLQVGDWPHWCSERLGLNSPETKTSIDRAGDGPASFISTVDQQLTVALESLATSLRLSGRSTEPFELLESEFRTPQGRALWPASDFAKLRRQRRMRIVSVAAKIAAYVRFGQNPEAHPLLMCFIKQRVPRRPHLSSEASTRDELARFIVEVCEFLRAVSADDSGLMENDSPALKSVTLALPLAWLATRPIQQADSDEETSH